MPLSPESPAAHPLPSSSARRPRSLASLARRRLSGAAPSLVALACYLLAVFGPFWNGTSGSGGGGGGGGGGAGGGEGLGARPTLVGLAYLAVSAAALFAAPLKEEREASPAPRPPSQTPHSWSRAWPAASGSVAALALLHSLAQLAAALPTPARRRLLPEDGPLRRFVAETVGLVVVKESSWGKHPYEASLQLARAVAGPVALLCSPEARLLGRRQSTRRGSRSRGRRRTVLLLLPPPRHPPLRQGRRRRRLLRRGRGRSPTPSLPRRSARRRGRRSGLRRGPQRPLRRDGARALGGRRGRSRGPGLAFALGTRLYALRVPWLREPPWPRRRGAAARLSWLGLLPPGGGLGGGARPGERAAAARRGGRGGRRQEGVEEVAAGGGGLSPREGGGGAGAALPAFFLRFAWRRRRRRGRAEEGGAGLLPRRRRQQQRQQQQLLLLPRPLPRSSAPGRPRPRRHTTPRAPRARHARLWAARVLETLWRDSVGAELARSSLVVAAFFAAPTALGLVYLGIAASSGKNGSFARRVAGGVIVGALALEALVRVGGPPPLSAAAFEMQQQLFDSFGSGDGSGGSGIGIGEGAETASPSPPPSWTGWASAACPSPASGPWPSRRAPPRC